MGIVLNIHEILKLLRERGYSDDQICKIARKHKCSLKRWEDGQTKPHITTLGRLVKALYDK